MSQTKRKPTKRVKRGECCTMDGCNRQITRTGAELCNACYSFMIYWQKKSPTQLMKRRRTLTFWEGRMDSLFPAKLRSVK